MTRSNNFVRGFSKKTFFLGAAFSKERSDSSSCLVELILKEKQIDFWVIERMKKDPEPCKFLASHDQ
jgi:hypothetical protein